jgi:hypothetical protein
MSKQLLKDGFGWGLLLWFIGYVLGIVLFMVVPVNLIGWVISPIGILLTLWVLNKKIKSQEIKHFIYIAIIWTIIAVLFDYVFLVQLFKPDDGYYKLDVFIYYLFTFLLPLLVGWRKSRIK